MEVNADMITIQGMVVSMDMSPVKLSTITQVIGNEMKISTFVKQIKQHLISKHYLVNDEYAECHMQAIQDIILFLVLNVKTDCAVDMPKYRHLVGVIPKLSKCIVSTVIVELNLGEHYKYVLNELAVPFAFDLVENLMQIMNKCKVKEHINCVFHLMDYLIYVCNTIDTEEFKTVSSPLHKLSSDLLLGLTGFYDNEDAIWSKHTISIHIGIAFCTVLKLLLKCDYNNKRLERIAKDLVNTCSCVMKVITVDDVITWAEVDDEDGTLQYSISSASYTVIQKFKDFTYADALLTMLNSIARKPKSLSDQIQVANISTTVRMVNKADANQKEWFDALFNCNILEDDEAIQCVHKNAHLCTEKHLRRLLSYPQSPKTNIKQLNKLVLKCSAYLSYEDLVVCVSRVFNNASDLPLFASAEEIKPQLVDFFNQLTSANCTIDATKREFVLLALQNVTCSLELAFELCLTNSMHSLTLRPVLFDLQYMAHVQDIAVKCLAACFQRCPDCISEREHTINAITMFFETKFIEVHPFIHEIVLPLLEEHHDTETQARILLLLSCAETIPLTVNTAPVVVRIVGLLSDYRCTFMTFDASKMNILTECVTILNKVTLDMTSDPVNLKEMVQSDDRFSMFYAEKVCNSSNASLIDYLYPAINEAKRTETIAHLVRILPTSVTSEWTAITVRLIEVFPITTVVDIASNAMILLCHILSSQKAPTDQVKTMKGCLKYCIEQYGVILNMTIKPRVNVNSANDRDITRHICKLLKHLSLCDDDVSDSGLVLTQLLSPECFTYLTKDNTFSNLIKSIKNSKVKERLSQYMLK